MHCEFRHYRAVQNKCFDCATTHTSLCMFAKWDRGTSSYHSEASIDGQRYRRTCRGCQLHGQTPPGQHSIHLKLRKAIFSCPKGKPVSGLLAFGSASGYCYSSITTMSMTRQLCEPRWWDLLTCKSAWRSLRTARRPYQLQRLSESGASDSIRCLVHIGLQFSLLLVSSLLFGLLQLFFFFQILQVFFNILIIKESNNTIQREFCVALEAAHTSTTIFIRQYSVATKAALSNSTHGFIVQTYVAYKRPIWLSIGIKHTTFPWSWIIIVTRKKVDINVEFNGYLFYLNINIEIQVFLVGHMTIFMKFIP